MELTKPLAVDLWFLNSLILDGHKQNTISIAVA